MISREVRSRSLVGMLVTGIAIPTLLGLPGRLYAQQPVSTPIAFTGVTVVDVRDGQLLADQTVVISGTQISAVGPASQVTVPKGTQTVNAQGKYLMPGLWDMHTHMWGYPDVFFPLLLANGVTGIRDMHGKFLDSMRLWRQEVVDGKRAGPRMLLTAAWVGPKFEDGEFGGWSSQIPLTTVERAGIVVDSLKAAGADHIKIRSGLSRELHFALSAAARRAGLPLVGHPTNGVTFREASDSGQRTLEHAYPCHPSETTDEECAALATQFVRTGTWLTPTSIAMLYLLGGILPDRARFWPSTVKGMPFIGIRTTDEGKDQKIQKFNQDILPRLAMLRRAGMPMLAGTDAAELMPENTPGLSLHDELAVFVQAGFTPLEALQAATLNPAKSLQATDSLGTVEAGKLADLVLLDANPLIDIQNAKAIRAVIANGRYFDRDHLDALIDGVERRGRGRPAGTP